MTVEPRLDVPPVALFHGACGRRLRKGARFIGAAFLLACSMIAPFPPSAVEAQIRKVRVAVPGYTIAVLSFLAAKMNGYYTGEGLDVELIAMRAPTANLALIGGNVDFSAVPLAGLTTRTLRIDEPTAAKLYDSSRPTLTSDGTVTGETEKKMTAMVLKIAGVKETPLTDKLYDFSFVRRAHAALQAKGWRPAS